MQHAVLHDALLATAPFWLAGENFHISDASFRPAVSFSTISRDYLASGATLPSQKEHRSVAIRQFASSGSSFFVQMRSQF